MQVTITVNLEEASAIISALSAMPYGKVAPLIEKVSSQCQTQIDIANQPPTQIEKSVE